MHPLDSLEEHHLHLAAAVSDPHAHPLDRIELQVGRIRRYALLTGSEQVHTQYLRPYLHICHVGSCVADTGE